MKELTVKQVEEFLRDLNKVSRKHKVIIGGCGCCGSPFLYYMEKTSGRYEIKEIGSENLHWKRNDDTK